MKRRLAVTAGLVLALGIPTTAHAADDYVVPTDPADELDVPRRSQTAAPRTLAFGADGAVEAVHRYAISYVAIPMRGHRLKVTRSRAAAMTRRVSDRMIDQTGGRFGYGMVGWATAPKTSSRRVSCDPAVVNRQYRSYAPALKRTPPGYRDTIAIYVTPARYRCDYAGIALLGGRAIVLNGVDNSADGLQDWITAHELGHTLGLEHAASFWPRQAGWTFLDPVPLKARQQRWNTYGDYLDLMGQPPNGGYGLPGARFGRWSFSSLHLQALGVLGRRNETIVRSSGRYTISAVTPDRWGGRMLLGIPVVADGKSTYWTMELRPKSDNAPNLNLPAPYPTRGYGVRLLLAGRGYRYPGAMNRVFHVSGAATAQAVLPVGRTVRLPRTGTVRVVSVTGGTATVDVSLS